MKEADGHWIKVIPLDDLFFLSRYIHLTDDGTR